MGAAVTDVTVATAAVAELCTVNPGDTQWGGRGRPEWPENVCFTELGVETER